MSLFRRAVVAALGSALIGAVPALAQSNRALVVGVFGGGYTHVNNLNTVSGQDADFRPGYNVGGTVGVQLNKIVSLHGDLTFARSKARGLSSFAGANVDRLFYGVHAEVAYQMMSGVKGYAFGGGGVMHIAQSSPQTFTPFNTAAGMLGLGMFLTVPGSNFDVMLEGKSMVYKFDRAGFNKNLWDVTYAIGLAYRVPLP